MTTAHRLVRGEILNAAPAIVASLVEAAKSGNTAAAKFLFEIAGLLDAPVEAERSAGEALAGTLLERLELGEFRDPPVNGNHNN